jgi:23S rRNA (adenine-N6)-dimethyltransferase
VSGNGTRRQWGWHPLRPDWARTIVATAGVRPGDLVLDLGAGTGALTAPLLDAGAHVVAIELHAGRLSELRARYGDRVTVVRADLRELRLPRRPFRVVASPPYQHTTELVRTLLGTDRLLSADLVLQRASARRLAAHPPGARHARRYRLEVGRGVPRSAFRPSPRVDSAVLRIVPRG